MILISLLMYSINVVSIQKRLMNAILIPVNYYFFALSVRTSVDELNMWSIFDPHIFSFKGY